MERHCTELLIFSLYHYVGWACMQAEKAVILGFWGGIDDDSVSLLRRCWTWQSQVPHFISLRGKEAYSSHTTRSTLHYYHYQTYHRQCGLAWFHPSSEYLTVTGNGSCCIASSSRSLPFGNCYCYGGRRAPYIIAEHLIDPSTTSKDTRLLKVWWNFFSLSKPSIFL